MKHTRKTQSPTSVTLGLVDEGEIMGMPAAWHTGPASSDRPEATSPSTATTLSRLMNFLTMVTDSPAVERLSSCSNCNCLPSTPPALLISSMARAVPSCDDTPKVASVPVSEQNSPTLMVSAPAAPAAPLSEGLHPAHGSAAVAAAAAATVARKARRGWAGFMGEVGIEGSRDRIWLWESPWPEARNLAVGFQSRTHMEHWSGCGLEAPRNPSAPSPNR